MKQVSSRRRPAQVSLKGTPSGRLARGVSARLAPRRADWRDLLVPFLLVSSLGLGIATGWCVGGSLPCANPPART